MADRSTNDGAWTPRDLTSAALDATAGFSTAELRALATRGGLLALLHGVECVAENLDENSADLDAGRCGAEELPAVLREGRDRLRALLPQTGESEGTDRANVETAPAEEVARIGLVPGSEVERLQDTLERERSQVAAGIGAVKEAIRKREWLRLGRGSFEWDDERWKDEFGHAIDEILQAMEPLRSIACDWSDCPTDPERIKRARETAPAIDGELLRSLLAEGFHTAFRKASEHKLSSQIHSLIRDLPQREWGEVIEFVAYGLESSFAAGHNALPAPMSEGERGSGIDVFLSDVRAEFHRGCEKFPGNELKTVALSEEFGELVKAVLDEAAADVRKEAVQLAAMCLRLVMDGDSSVDGWRERNGLDALSKREDG